MTSISVDEKDVFTMIVEELDKQQGSTIEIDIDEKSPYVIELHGKFDMHKLCERISNRVEQVEDDIGLSFHTYG